MANCEDIKDKNSQAYKDCVEENKIKSTTDKSLKADVSSLFPTVNIFDDNKEDTGELDFNEASLFKINKTTTRGGAEVKTFLEEYTSEIPGLSYDLEQESVYGGMGVTSKGLQKLRLSYKDKDGKIIKSDLINFQSGKKAEDNLNTIKNFFDENLSEDELNLLNQSLIQKSQEQLEQNNGTLNIDTERDILTSRIPEANFGSLYIQEEDGEPDENGNPKLIPNLGIFDSYEKTVSQQGRYVGPSRKETIYPYSEELQVNIDKLTNNNLELKKPKSVEEIQEEAKRLTIIDLTTKKLNEAKSAKRAKENDESLQNQARAFIGNAALKSTTSKEFTTLLDQADTAANNLNLYEETLDLYTKVTDGVATKEDYELIAKNNKILNLNVETDFFKS